MDPSACQQKHVCHSILFYMQGQCGLLSMSRAHSEICIYDSCVSLQNVEGGKEQKIPELHSVPFKALGDNT